MNRFRTLPTLVRYVEWVMGDLRQRPDPLAMFRQCVLTGIIQPRTIVKTKNSPYAVQGEFSSKRSGWS